MGQLLAKRTGKPAETVGAQPQEAGPAALPAPVSTVPDFELIELLFFAYRDFVGDADRLLEEFGFGRAHHRVLHFVNRHPGLTIAELLDILNITKQSLNRVLKELLEQGYVEARAGQSDRRQRRLFPAPRGEALALHLSQLQSARFARALRQLPPGARAGAVEFLLALIDEPARARVSALVRGQGKPSARQGES